MPFDFAFPQASSQPASEPGEGWDFPALLVDWIAAGLSEEAFWSFTPRQVARHFDAARKRYRREHDMQMSIAYVAAMAPNMKKPTPLADLLFGDGNARRQTPEERLAIVQQWATVKNR